MLADKKIVAFIPTAHSEKAKNFYSELLGLRLLSEDPFALVFDAQGTTLRVVKVEKFTPAQFTVLGWEVPQIENSVSELKSKGIRFEIYGMPGQDENGIWSAPGGAKVAWFKDPDGNVLSISQMN